MVSALTKTQIRCFQILQVCRTFLKGSVFVTVGLAVEIKSRFQIFSGVVWRLTKKTIGKILLVTNNGGFQFLKLKPEFSAASLA